MASISGSSSSSSYDPQAFRMPSVRAASSAFSRLREAMAATSIHSAFWIAGITFRVAILATPRTPDRTLARAKAPPFAIAKQNSSCPTSIGRFVGYEQDRKGGRKERLLKGILHCLESFRGSRSSDTCNFRDEEGTLR